MLVEVKGPRDHLSAGQRAWLRRLSRSGVAVQVCHVKETVAAEQASASD